MMQNLLKKIFYRKHAEKVADFYDNWSERFLTVTDTFQGFRTERIEEMHNYTIQSAGLTDGDVILDAGCGVGGPGFYFAQKLKAQIYFLTISREQIKILNQRKEDLGIENIHVVQGDYHELSKIFQPGFFTHVLFLESFGHSYNPQKILKEVNVVLRKGGAIYVRDPFMKKSDSPETVKEINRLVQLANEAFLYNHQPLDVIARLLHEAGFSIEYCRHPHLEINITIDKEVEEKLGLTIPKGNIPFIETLEVKAIKN